MCGRTTRNYTWEQIHAMYQLLRPAAIPNMQPSFNVCPTDPVDVVVEHEGQRQLEVMRWGLVPFWWSKPLKELRSPHSTPASRRSPQSRSFGSRSKADAA